MAKPLKPSLKQSLKSSIRNSFLWIGLNCDLGEPATEHRKDEKFLKFSYGVCHKT